MSRNFEFEVRDPRAPTKDLVKVVIPGDLIERCYRHAPTQYENFRAAKFVLENPQRIFAGIRTVNEGGWCYVGRPSKWYVRENVVAPFPDGHVFAAYVNPRFCLYEFRAEKAAEDDCNSPINWAERYGALVWKNTF